MSLPVNVQSIDVLTDFRAVLGRVGEDARNALAAADMEINRMIDWLNNDRKMYWQAEIQRRRAQLAQAKSELFRKRTSRMYGHEGSFSEQREIVREATQRLELAEKKLERVRQWVLPLQQAVMEYRAASRPLADMVEGDLQNALALLERMARALEQYSSDPLPTTAYVQAMRRPGSEPTASSEPPVSTVEKPTDQTQSEAGTNANPA